MERSHVRVHTPGLFSKGNSVEIHLECLADSQFCFPLPGGKVISAYGSRGGHSGADIKTKANDSILCVFDGVVRMAKSYGGRGGHSGADIKTKANDSILCVFDGVVRMAKSYGGTADMER